MFKEALLVDPENPYVDFKDDIYISPEAALDAAYEDISEAYFENPFRLFAAKLSAKDIQSSDQLKVEKRNQRCQRRAYNWGELHIDCEPVNIVDESCRPLLHRLPFNGLPQKLSTAKQVCSAFYFLPRDRTLEGINQIRGQLKENYHYFLNCKLEDLDGPFVFPEGYTVWHMDFKMHAPTIHISPNLRFPLPKISEAQMECSLRAYAMVHPILRP